MKIHKLFSIFLLVFVLCGIACAEDNVADTVTNINPADFTESNDGVLFTQGVDATAFDVTVNASAEEVTVSLDAGANAAHTQVIGVPLTTMPSYEGYLFVQHFNETGVCDGFDIVQPVVDASYAYLEVNLSTVTITPLVSEVNNWCFENWFSDTLPTGWSFSGSGLPSRSTDVVLGSYSYKLVTNSTGTSGILSQTTELTPGYYTVGAWVKCTNGTSGALYIDLYGGSPVVDTTGAVLYSTTNPGEWQYIERREYVNSSNPQLRIFVSDSPSIGSTWLVNGVIVSPDYSYTATESDDREHIYLNFTYTPAVEMPISTMSVVLSEHDLSTENISTVSTKIDGIDISTFRVEDTLYIDTSWFSTDPHQVNITIDYTPQVPVVEFMSNVSYVNHNYTVQFTDLSTGYIDSWYWDFGDGSNSTLQNPTHTYATDGIYTVTLDVTGPGGTSSLPKYGMMTVTAVPTNNYSQYYQRFFTADMGGWDFVSHTSDFWNTLLPSEFFWMIVILIPYLTIYNRTGSIIIPAVLYLFIGGALAVVMPPMLATLYYWFIILGAGGVIYRMFIGD
jgi:hypothetical protein